MRWLAAPGRASTAAPPRATWVDSLLPGYPTDTSPEGLASPLQQRGITNAGDPVQAWDLQGRLFYMGNAFNRAAPQNGSVWVATYDQDAAHYVRTVIVGKAGPALNGRFNDKTSIEVDRGVNSPSRGNVYAAWSLFQGNGNNSIQFVRSTDHGATFSQPAKISTGSKDVQFADIAVTSNGTVYVAYRQFESERGGTRRASIQYVVSTDGGATFSKAATAASSSPSTPRTPPATRRPPRRRTSRPSPNADGPESEAGEESVGDSRDCGSGPFACQSGFVFFRHDSQPRITADPKSTSQNVYLVYDATIPGTEQASQTTYNTADPRVPRCAWVRAAIYFATLTSAGWTTPRLLAPTARGHQFFPDINADGGVLHAVWHDSRNDPAYSVQYPPGNNGAVRDAAGFAAATHGLDTYAASSTNGGTAGRSPGSPAPARCRTTRCSATGGSRSTATTTTSPPWGRSPTTPGPTPGRSRPATTRATPAAKDSTSCSAAPRMPTGTWSADTCPNAGGLDQDIYGAATTG